VVAPCGEWRIHLLDRLALPVPVPLPARVVLDGSQLLALDTAGALQLLRLLGSASYEIRDFSPTSLAILRLVEANIHPSTPLKQEPLHFIPRVGKTTFEIADTVKTLFAFIGHTSTDFARIFWKPQTLRLKELFVQLELAFVNSIPIISLVTFLIGVVIAYLFAIQIERYGANIFIVDGVALAMCRELSPVIVAIVIAGRSGSAFTAQIGTMKLNEEIDALTTLGLSPIQVLVIPRILALIVAMPLLTFLGDVVGILGGMVIAHSHLGITSQTFIERLSTVLPPRHITTGLIKAPVFAAFIAIIGCRMGLTVENNARAVGLSTTATVVQSIVSVILLNAAFAVIFQQLGV
jgi:phospholipid/cholesterol/gamma-HCH transport system permease protein